MEAITTKVCSKCKLEKSIDQFYFRKDTNTYRNTCKSCCNINSEKFRIDNPMYSSTYNRSHTDKVKRYNNNYRTTHPENIRKNHREYMRTRNQNDVNFKLIGLMRKSLHRLLKSTKRLHTNEYFCCTHEQLWNHLEKQFRDGMTKENHGKVWHVDHIIPLQFFIDNDLMDETNMKLAFHYGNLQPLFVYENLSKCDIIPCNAKFIY